jgi:hypothetical protein
MDVKWEVVYVAAVADNGWLDGLCEDGSARTRGIVRDLWHVRHRGLFRCEAAHLENIAEALAQADRRLSAEAVRLELRRLLMGPEAHRDPDADWASLTTRTQINLTLFRATAELSGLKMIDARERAAALIDPKHPPSSDTLRRKGGREHQLVARLRDLVLDRADGPSPVPPVVFTPPLEGKPRLLDSRTASAPTRVDAADAPPETVAVETDHDRDFWLRQSTRDYILRLAALEHVTIYAGADGPADVGPPIHRDLLATMLWRHLPEDALMREVPPERRHPMAGDVVKAMVASGVPAAYLGSILTQVLRRRDTQEGEGGTADGIDKAVQREIRKTHRTSSGFVSRSITRLALTLRLHRRDVQVLSAHYDDDLYGSVDLVRATSGDRLNDVHYDKYPLKDASSVTRRVRRVPLIKLNDPMVLGEGPLLCVRGEEGEMRPAPQIEVLSFALRTSNTILVGSSIDDPGVLAAVAAVREDASHERYALLLPPDRFPLHPDSADFNGDGQSLEPAFRHALLAERYRHLGVTPIIADFPYQVPQLLREIALAVEQGKDYVSYAERSRRWWTPRAARLGYSRDRGGSGSRDAFQEQWYDALRYEERQIVAALLPEPEDDGQDEELHVDVWIREPGARRLFRWATSKEFLRSDRASEPERLRLADSESVAAVAYREGAQMVRRHEGTEPWCVWAMPLTLYNAPWFRLPVGVLEITSNKASGGLASSRYRGSAQALRYEIVGRVSRLLLED